MKITSETATQLTATDKNLVLLFISPVFAIVGIALAVAGFSSHSTGAIVGGVLFALIGIGILFLRKVRTLTIDKSAGTLSLATKSLTGSKTFPANLSDVAKLQLVSEFRTTYNNSSGDSSGSGISFGNANRSTEQTTQLLLVLRDGTTMDLAEGSRSMNAMAVISHVPNQEVGKRIADFIGVPFETVGPSVPSASDVVGAIQGMLHPNDAAPSVTPQPQQPVAPPPPLPTEPPSPNGPGFAMPRAPLAPPPAATPPTAPPSPPPQAAPPATPPPPSEGQPPSPPAPPASS